MHKVKLFAMGGYNDEMNFPDMPPGPGYGGVGPVEMPVFGGLPKLPSGPQKAVSPKLGQLAKQQMRQQMQLQKASQQAVKQRMQEQKLQEHRLQQMARGTGPYRQNKPTTFSNTTPIAPRPQPLPMPEMPPKDFGEPGAEVGGKRVQSPYMTQGMNSPQRPMPPMPFPKPIGQRFDLPQPKTNMNQGMNQGMNGPMPTPSMGMQPNIQNTLMPMQQGMNQGMNKPMPTPSANKMGMFKKGGSVKAYAKGGSVSASSRGDGCAQRGKTRGKMV
jgi:hypothetical protein